ncbi:MAG: AAA family ATPase [Propionibacteriaceae bacterium]|jgi:predicted AAA+ superfamily ATPase|nr:AAA family ATPase [Propionibacteriaceae bacterium]
MYQRALVQQLADRLNEPRHFMQIVVGPRQTGKTTAVTQSLKQITLPSRFVSVDEAVVPSREWLSNEWDLARQLALSSTGQAVLVIDEIQKVPQWSSAVKALWDEDSRLEHDLQIVLTGSSSMLVQRGLEESLMGRFEVLYCHHWNYAECQQAFGYTLDDFLYFGGYPGAALLRHDEARWARYMGSSIVEPTISQDVLSMEQVRKPALLRALFRLGAIYSAQELSYTKLQGQLQDAGNTVTLAHYLDLLGKAGMLCGLQRFSLDAVQTRNSSPRLLVFDTSLMTYGYGASRSTLMDDRTARGHLVESAIGAHLLARSQDEGFDLFWWRDRSNEVDFVIRQGDRLTAIEVKSGTTKRLDGLDTFMKRYPRALALVIGTANCTLEQFLLDEVPLFRS